MLTTQRIDRKLAAILAADAVGYSRLMGRDEEIALVTLNKRRVIIDALIDQHGGRIFGSAGDSVIAEFSSAVEAVRCAVEIQTQLRQVNDGSTEAPMHFRIGINVGDVMVKDGNILGDGVNVAARLESFAPSGGVCISGQLAEQLSGNVDAVFVNAGRHRLKNIAKPLDIWCWPPESASSARHASKSWRRTIVIRTVAGVTLVALAAIGVYRFSIQDKVTSTTSRIAVIPFSNASNSREYDYFADGLTKDINTLLSKFSNLFVIAPLSTAAFRDQPDCKTIRNELQADYILEGTVRRSRDNLWVTTAFTDAKVCQQLDSPGPFDRVPIAASVFDIQLEIAKKVVAEIGSADAPLFNTRVQAEVRRKAPGTLAAYECVLLSYWFYETFTSDRHRRALACLQRALKIDPGYSLGWSRLAFSYIEAKKYAIDTPSDWAELSRAAANQAINLDPDNPDAYYALAILSQMLGESATVFRNFANKAIELNPNDAFVLADLGTWMGYTGEWDTAKEWVSRAMLLNPKHQGWLHQTWHLYHYLKGEYAESRDAALQMNLPDNYMVQASLTAAYAMNGELEKARKTLAHLREIRPGYANDPRAPFRARNMPSELIERLMDGLRKAGLDVPAEKAGR